jgi:hypothetical protein
VKEVFLSIIELHNVNDVRQIQIHTAEPLVPRPGYLEVEIATLKWTHFNCPGCDQILAELIQVEGE